MGKNPLLFLLLFLSMIACKERPNFPSTPNIEIVDLYFRELNGILLDSLIIKIKFEDGDGDLGLESTEISSPYQILDPVTDSSGDTLRYGDDGTPPYNCVDYEIMRKESSVGDSLVSTADTIYVVRNLDHYNFFLYFLVEQDDGSFEEYNPALERNCAPPYHGRYFILNTMRDIRPLTGELKYAFISGFRLLFRNEVIKIKIQIQDQLLNKSNIIVTDPFIIGDIILPP